jgi:hypothetical protein
LFCGQTPQRNAIDRMTRVVQQFAIVVFFGNWFMKFLSLAVVALVVLAPLSVAARSIECTLSPNANSGGWVTDRYFFEVDEDAGVAQAIDAVVQHYNKGPIQARLVDSSSKKLVISWDVKMTNATGQMTKMQYRASIFKGDNTVIVRAVPGGYSNQFEARGTCK